MKISALRRPDRLSGLYYGWIMLGGLSLAQVTSWGILSYSFSVFITPLRREFGWSSAEVTGAYSLAMLLSGLVAFPVGRWLDRRGPRLLMTAGSCAATLLVLAWSRVEGLATFYLVWAGIGLVMATVLYEPAFYVVANWFERQRSRALTLLTFVGGFASVVYIPLASWLVAGYGWRAALVLLAGILAAGTIPIHLFLLRRHPRDLGLEPDGGPVPVQRDGSPSARPLSRASATVPQALRDPGFWWLTAGFVLIWLAKGAMTVHLIPYLLERGFSASFAATAAGLVGLFALPGRLIFTPLGTRIPRRYVAALIFLLQAVSLVVLLEVSGTAGILAFVVLFGAGYGAITPARAALVAESYGPANYGGISGVLALWITVGRSIAPFTAGLLVTALNDYAPVIWILTGASLLAAFAAVQSRSRLVLAPAGAEPSS